MAHGANRLLTVSPRLMDKFVRRFWVKVRFRTSFDDCWEWRASRCVFGHGQVGFPGSGSEPPLKSHAAAYVLAFGEIADGREVCHLCDNPPCVNPLHLYAGTHSHNMRDRVDRERNDAWEQFVSCRGLMLGHKQPEDSPFDHVHYAAAMRVVRTLRPNERFVIESRFGLSGQEPMTLEQCGKKMKRTRERVRQLEERSIRKMRERIESLNLL